MKKLFKELRVLDLSTVLAGPSVATFFAELGATVIKVENPHTKGDVTRSWKLSNEEATSSVSAYFSSINFGKTYEWLDLTEPNNRKRIEELIVWSDIVIVNFKEGDDAKFRLAASDVQQLKPSVIYASLKGFHSDTQRIAYDVVLQAECGFMFMNGNVQSGPLKMPVALIDVIAAHQLKEGILCALLNRTESGKGLIVRVTLEEAALSALVNQASNYLMAGHIPQTSGSLHPNIAPYGETFTCSDSKSLVLAVGSDKQFRTLCSILNINDTAGNLLYVDNQSRVANRQELAAILQEVFATHTRDYWMSRMISEGIPAGAIKSMDEVMRSPAAQAMIREEEIDEHPTRRISSIAFKLEF
jgi:crotonobetainyl-CoA:carnitine CoA-transferase CaiB-like acyl-CoA transferase